MPLSPLQKAQLCKSQYDDEDIFDYQNRIEQVSFALKFYPDETIISCEGSKNIPDWWSNIQFRMIKVPGLGMVEEGFFMGIDDTVADLAPRMDKSKPVRPIGHSRGASHARLIAVRLKALGFMVDLTTFESPHTGDADFEALVQTFPNVTYRNYRSFDAQDPVCTVPFFDFLACRKYATPINEIIFDQAPVPFDSWLLLARHHIELVIKELQNETVSPSPIPN